MIKTSFISDSDLTQIWLSIFSHSQHFLHFTTFFSMSQHVFFKFNARLIVGPSFDTNLLTRLEYSVPTFWPGSNTRFQHSDPAWYRLRVDTRSGFPIRLAKESNMTSRGLNIEIFPVFRLCITFLHYLFALPFW